MPVIMFERRKSRAAQIAVDPAGSTQTLLFMILGTIDDGVVKATVETGSPPTYAGMFRQSYTIQPRGNGVWDADVKYAPLLPKQAGESQFSFDTAGGTAHVTVSKETLLKYSWDPNVDDEDAPEYAGAIGVNGDSVEGCDIHTAQYAFQETHYIPAALITPEYKAILFRLTSKLNAAIFKGFAIGEVLFLGASGSFRGLSTNAWEISYKFLASPDTDPLLIGGDPNKAIQKLGWTYVWSRFEEKVDPNNPSKFIVKQPLFTYEEEVYDFEDFSLLGIGT